MECAAARCTAKPFATCAPKRKHTCISLKNCPYRCCTDPGRRGSTRLSLLASSTHYCTEAGAHMNSAPLPPAAAASHSNASDGGQLSPPSPDSNYKRHLASPSPGVEDTPSSTQKVQQQQQQQQQQQEQLCVASSSPATTSPVHTVLTPTANGNTQQPSPPSHPDLLLPNTHAQPTTPSSLSWKPMMPR